jgi:hypothetical protein
MEYIYLVKLSLDIIELHTIILESKIKDITIDTIPIIWKRTIKWVVRPFF